MDGVPTEWVPADRFADLTDGGYGDRQIRATLYLHHDCASGVLYAYVRAFGDGRLKRDRPENAYLRIDGAGKLVGGLSGDDGTPPDFAWVGVDGTHARGWEASGTIAPGRYTLRAHVLLAWDDADGYLPLDTVPRTTALVLSCDDDDDATMKPTPKATPKPAAKPTPGPTPAAKPKPTPTARAAATAAPTPKPSRDEDEDPKKDKDGQDGDGDKDSKNGDKDQDSKNGDKDTHQKKDKDNSKDGDKESGNQNGGIILVLPLLAGTAAWSTRPVRLRRQPRAR